jgi:hypothetical protein
MSGLPTSAEAVAWWALAIGSAVKPRWAGEITLDALGLRREQRERKGEVGWLTQGQALVREKGEGVVLLPHSGQKRERVFQFLFPFLLFQSHFKNI